MPAASPGGMGGGIGGGIGGLGKGGGGGSDNGRGGSDNGRGGRNGDQKTTLNGGGVEVRDSLVTTKESRKDRARAEESADLRQSRGLRRGRRATLLANIDAGLGGVNIGRPEGRRARLLG